MIFRTFLSTFFAALLIVFSAIFLSGCSSNKFENSIKIRVDNFPKYATPGLKKSHQLKQMEQNFINKVVVKFGDRNAASRLWWQQGEKFMQAGNADFAMRRYNQSWLLDPENFQPYWGFSRVMMKGDNADEAIKYLEKALELVAADPQKSALLADLATAYSIKGENSHSYYSKANKAFSQSVKLDENYAPAWRRWAYSLYKQGRFAEALEKVNQAKALNAKPFSDKFITDLQQKLKQN
ncbi:MAG: tetratricopeptide repeat protein [Candidatus Thioglobus sp.]|nr:tetratricopeptide repeat protein [Candidatus Thioglobus sp.]